MRGRGVKKKEICVGLDIGTRLIKAVEVSLENDIYKLLKFHFAEIDLPPTQEKANAALKSFLKDFNPNAKEVNISLSAPSAIVRFINMPKMKEEELKNSIRYEADKYVPFDVSEIVTDVSILGEAAEDKSKMKIILAAAKKDVVNSKISVLKQEGFSVLIIDIDSFACFNAFCYSRDNIDKSKNIALLNIGYSQTNIIISQGDTPYFTRDIQIGARDIAKVISRNMEEEEKESDRLIFNPKDKSPEVFEIAKPVLNTLADELRLSFGYYENQYGRGIDEIYISGGVTRLSGITGFLEESFGVKPVIWNPFSKFEIDPNMDAKSLQEIQSQFAVCAGLAIRR